MSQYIAELCTLMVYDSYGELPSQIFSALNGYGRLNIANISYYTNLKPSQVRHYLALLVQQRLVHHQVTSDGLSHYEVNLSSAYASITIGKQLSLVRSKFGATEAFIIWEVHVAGQCCFEDLENVLQEYETRKSDKYRLNPDVPRHTRQGQGSRDAAECGNSVWDAFSNLLNARLLTISHGSNMRSPADNQREAEAIAVEGLQVLGSFKGEERKMFNDRVQRAFEDWNGEIAQIEEKLKARVEIRRAQRTLKRPPSTSNTHLESDSIKKRAKLNGIVEFGRSRGIPQMTSIEPNVDIMIRLNYDKLSLLVKCEILKTEAGRALSKASAMVYSGLLNFVERTTKFHRTEDLETILITEGQVFDELETIDSLTGTLAPLETGSRGMNWSGLRPSRERKDKNSKNESADGSSAGRHSEPWSDSGVNEENNMTQTEMIGCHLLLLAEHPTKFLQEHPSGRKWMVPFCSIFSSIRLLTIKDVIAFRHGLAGARLASILNEKGKLDEKALLSSSLLDQKTLRQALAKMHRDGLLELQEVPRDGSRQTSRTMFLWFFDPYRSALKILDDIYKTMARLVQRLKVERESVDDVLTKASRSDVEGLEEKLLSSSELSRLQTWKGKETQIYGQLYRLDDMVHILRSE